MPNNARPVMLLAKWMIELWLKVLPKTEKLKGSAGATVVYLLRVRQSGGIRHKRKTPKLIAAIPPIVATEIGTSRNMRSSHIGGS